MQPENQECGWAQGYQILTLLGDGGQANVYLGRKQNLLYAVKIYFPGQSRVQAFKIEYEFLKKLNFKNLINVIDGNVEGKVKMTGKLQQIRPVLILQYAQGGQLFQHLKQQGRFRPQLCRPIFKSLINAIKYLDSQGISHRDLKSQNILFDKNFILKVSDFGLSTYSQGHDGDGILYSKVGTEGYRPPQMQNGKYQGLQADIFGAGVILFIMFNGTPPFLSAKSHNSIYKYFKEKNYEKFWKVHEKKKPQGFYPKEFKDLINSFFSYDPKQRPTFESLEKDPWLNGDQAMQNQIQAELKERYQKIASQDQIKKKVEQLKLKFKSQIIQQQQNNFQLKRCKSQFYNDYVENYGIHVQNLPISDKKLPFINEKPGFIVAWLKNFIEQKMDQQKQECMIDCSFSDCKAENHKFQVANEKYIRVSLVFDFDGQSEEFIINGKIVRNGQNYVSVDWQKQQGNDFYLNDIISQFNQQLSLLA